jgi:sialate O-acetylesterase
VKRETDLQSEKAKADFEKATAKWKEDTEKMKAAGLKPGQQLPRAPQSPDGWLKGNGRPGNIFNGVLNPTLGYGIKGVIWYQGEANTGSPTLYRKLFPALITSWRKAWGEGEFPFLFAQLSSFMPRASEPSESNWAELREAQALALKLPKTGMAVTVDIGGERELHLKNKREAGRRLAFIAEAMVYGKTNVTASGPVFSNMKTVANKVTLLFKQTSGGLIDKNGPPLKGFAIAGADKKFFWADAKIEAPDKVSVRSDKVPKPVAVRYAWAGTPDCDLFNKAGLPAAPFRTDSWEHSPLPQASPPAQ